MKKAKRLKLIKKFDFSPFILTRKFNSSSVPPHETPLYDIQLRYHTWGSPFFIVSFFHFLQLTDYN